MTSSVIELEAATWILLDLMKNHNRKPVKEKMRYEEICTRMSV